mgnify:CR=1 FL=1
MHTLLHIRYRMEHQGALPPFLQVLFNSPQVAVKKKAEKDGKLHDTIFPKSIFSVILGIDLEYCFS